jgi:hypothetical protein
VCIFESLSYDTARWVFVGLGTWTDRHTGADSPTGLPYTVYVIILAILLCKMSASNVHCVIRVLRSHAMCGADAAIFCVCVCVWNWFRCTATPKLYWSPPLVLSRYYEFVSEGQKGLNVSLLLRLVALTGDRPHVSVGIGCGMHSQRILVTWEDKWMLQTVCVYDCVLVSFKRRYCFHVFAHVAAVLLRSVPVEARGYSPLFWHMNGAKW